MTKIYKSKIDLWVYAIIPFIFICCMLGPILTDTDYWFGCILGVIFSIFVCSMFISTKYAVRGNDFGVKYLCKWNWFPIDKVESIKLTRGISASTALSTDRIAIKFSDRKILKSAAPLEISPKNRQEFISELLKINPGIKYSDNK